jgi:hypothetical protein
MRECVYIRSRTLRCVNNPQSLEDVFATLTEWKNNVVIKHVTPDKGSFVAPVSTINGAEFRPCVQEILLGV